MIRVRPLVTVAIVLLAVPARAQMRLEGLDRLYFDRVAEAGAPLPARFPVAAQVPATLPGPRHAEADAPIDPDEDISTRDIVVPGRTRAIWIRQVVDRSHPRIFEVWWALYDAGRRGDVWHFTAMPDRTDGKMLGNYDLENVTRSLPNEVVFRVRSGMFRPFGMWWISGKAWTFAAGDRALTFVRVLNVFSLSQGYDNGGAPPPLSASTERETGGAFESRVVDEVTKALQRECRYEDPREAAPTWEEMEAVARCITTKPIAKAASRALNAPSFIERSGKP